jgi:hypothetical protein
MLKVLSGILMPFSNLNSILQEMLMTLSLLQILQHQNSLMNNSKIELNKSIKKVDLVVLVMEPIGLKLNHQKIF